MFRGGTLKNMRVINAANAEKIGRVCDIEIDEKSGVITGVVVRRDGFFRRIFGIGEIILPWSAVAAVSEEYILADTVRLLDK